MDQTVFRRAVFARRLILGLAAFALSSCDNPVEDAKPSSAKSSPANNFAPTITSPSDATINQDGSTTISFTIGDADGPTLDCQRSIYLSTSDQYLLPPTRMVRSGTAPNCRLTLSPAPGYWGTAQVGITVYDGKYSASTTFNLVVNQGPPVATVANASANEGSNVTFTVQLSAASPLPKVVAYQTTDGTAQAGTNYTSTSGSLTFAPGETSKTVSVPTTHDNVYTSNLAFTFSVTAVGVTNTATGTVVNTDAAPTASAADVSANEGSSLSFTVNLNRLSASSTTVTYATANGTAQAGANYTATSGTLTFLAGESSKTVTVPSLDDNVYTGDLTFTLGLTANGTTNNATGTVVNTDTAPTASAANVSANEGSSLSFSVTLNRLSSSSTTVTYATANGTAQAGTNYTATSGTLTFAAGESVKTVTVPSQADSTYSADLTFQLGLTANGVTNNATGTIVNTDAVPVISLAADQSSLTEGASAGFTISLDHASAQTIQVNYATADGTATAASGDYTSTSGTATINPGALSAHVSVPTADDNADETDETFSLGLSSPVNATLGTATASVTIVDTALFFNFLSGSLPSGVTFTRASPATYFDSTGTLQTATAGTPRFDYNPTACAGTCPLRGLLIEEARTNLALYSQDFTQTWASNGAAGVTVTANATAAPDGTNTAGTVASLSNGLANTDRVEQSIALAASTDYTLSFFVKNAGAAQSAFQIVAPDSGTTGKTSTITWSGGVPSLSLGTAVALPNGWYRVSFSFTTDSLDAGAASLQFEPGNSAADNGGAVYLWGAQLEAGATPTSYIATTATAASRAAEALSVNSFASWFHAAGFTAILDFSRPYYEAASAAATPNLFSTCDDTSSGTCATDHLEIAYAPTDQTFRGRYYVGSVNGASSNYTSGGGLAGTTVQAALSLNATGQLRTVVNGTAAALSSAGTPPTTHAFLIGSGGTAGSPAQQLNGHLKKFTYRARALTQAQMQALTSD